MLSPEEAQRRLQLVADSQGAQKREERMAALPSEMRQLWQQFHNDWHRAAPKVVAGIEALGPKGRQQWFEALCPQLGEAIESCWNFFDRQPYQAGYTRRPFRAPGVNVISQAPLRWLQTIVQSTAMYPQNIEWYAVWAPYAFPYYNAEFGRLFAATIDQGGPAGDRIFDILLSTAKGEHEIGMFGRHVSGALLMCSRPEGWAYLEKMLIAAQRQEGLRQAILEAVDEGHPEAFARMLRLIRSEGLTRFSATIRAVDVWLGFGYEALDEKTVSRCIDLISTFLDDPAARARAIESGAADELFLALWSTAFTDAVASIVSASMLAADADVERRFAAAYHLQQVHLPQSALALVPFLDDTDLRIAAVAQAGTIEYPGVQGDLFERYEGLLARIPEKMPDPSPIVWPWMKVNVDASKIAGGLVATLGNRPPDRLIPYVARMSTWDKAKLLELLGVQGTWTGEARELLFAMAGDLAASVREAAYKQIAKCKPTTDEAKGLEVLLRRKSDDLRRGIVTVLLAQEDGNVIASAERLIAGKETGQRTAGLEMLRSMAQSNRQEARCKSIALEYKERKPEMEEAERAVLDFLESTENVTLDDALGLAPMARRTPAVRPLRPKNMFGMAKDKVALESSAALACLDSLDALIQQNRETSTTVKYGVTERDVILGTMQYGLGHSWTHAAHQEMPFRELFETWWRDRPKQQRDSDGFELLRASAHLTRSGATRYNAKSKYKYPQLILSVVDWMSILHPVDGTVDFLLDAVETSLASITDADLVPPPPGSQDLPAQFALANYLNAGNTLDLAGMFGQGPNKGKHEKPWIDWRHLPERTCWLALARQHRQVFDTAWSSDHHARLFRLLRWYDEPKSEFPRMRPQFHEVLAAYKTNGATEEDLIDLLIGQRQTGNYGRHFQELYQVSARKPSTHFPIDPIAAPIVDRVRRRIIDVELRRGDMPTVVTSAVSSLRYSGGLDALVRLVKAFGKESFFRGYSYGADRSRAASFSHLIRATFPGADDTSEAFSAAMKSAGITDKRLVEVAVYAPQWARHTEVTLGWPGFSDAVWWIHGHTKDQQWSVEMELREAWAAELSSVTPLTPAELLEGAVDVALFHAVYDSLGPQRWKMIDDAAKYASSGGGHKRAQLFADAMLGKVDEETLTERIIEKRHQDSVRALGLAMLPEDSTSRKQSVLRRYESIQEFKRGSRKFGSQRQESEKTAANIGMENLARTAGYPDPIRLEWAMEAEAVRDLAEGPVSATVGDTIVTLSIDAWGDPALVAVKGGKALKTIPPALRKDPVAGPLIERKSAIGKQGSRIRLSLEAAMCRGDLFAVDELRELMAHPVIRPILAALVLMTEDADLLGYPVDGGAALERYDGAVQRLPVDQKVRIAHPHDLLSTGAWEHWQHECFRHERIQPFKQVFRELYVLTEAEKKDAYCSQRYSGHQINRGQAMGIFNKRGWVGHPDEGDVRKTFHAEGITISLNFDYGYTTPGDVEGLTIDVIGATRRNDYKSLPLSEVPARVFSEAMRDLDLVVSVAHQGGVDPEASTSTVQMRGALVREAAALLKLPNVRLQGETHVIVEGKLGTYSVHLGSATVHRMPGGHLCIVPVHSQHRGRVFLPFMDSDPRTAEVVSKVIMLAKDQEIKDPVILEQIYAKA